MGSLYLNQEDFEKAKSYYEESLKLHTEINKKSGIAANVNNLSKVYTATEEYAITQEFLLRSLALKRANNDLEGIANSHKNLGDNFLYQEMLDSARQYYHVALRWQDSLGLRGDEASSFADLGVVSLEEKKWQNAADWCTKGWEQALEIGDLKVQVKNGGCLYQALQKLGKPEEALAVLEETSVLQDSFRSAANTRELTKLEAAYQQQKEALEREIAGGKQPLRYLLFLLVAAFLGLFSTYYFRRKKQEEKTTTRAEAASELASKVVPLTQQPKLPPLSSEMTTTASDAAWVEQLDELLKGEIANPDFTVDQMAQALFISRSKLQRRVKKATGLTPVRYFRELKLKVAMELMASGKVETVKQASTAVGFDTPQYFSKIFEQHFGKKPGEWL